MGKNTTKGNFRGAKTPRFNDVQFIQFELSAEEAAHLKEQANDGSAVLDLVQRCIDAGYRVSSKHDERGDCYAVFMQPTDPEHEYAGFILPARGSTLLKALKQLMYKHFVSFEGDWGNAHAYASNVPIDD